MIYLTESGHTCTIGSKSAKKNSYQIEIFIDPLRQFWNKGEK